MTAIRRRQPQTGYRVTVYCAKCCVGRSVPTRARCCDAGWYRLVVGPDRATHAVTVDPTTGFDIRVSR